MCITIYASRLGEVSGLVKVAWKTVYTVGMVHEEILVGVAEGAA